MGIKLLWTGLTFIEATSLLDGSQKFVIAGAVVMAIGCILMWLDK